MYTTDGPQGPNCLLFCGAYESSSGRYLLSDYLRAKRRSDTHGGTRASLLRPILLSKNYLWAQRNPDPSNYARIQAHFTSKNSLMIVNVCIKPRSSPITQTNRRDNDTNGVNKVISMIISSSRAIYCFWGRILTNDFSNLPTRDPIKDFSKNIFIFFPRTLISLFTFVPNCRNNTEPYIIPYSMTKVV